jgi:tetratricopeptide (TPR) repeat protein
LPLLQGLIAFANADYDATVALIDPIEDRIYLVGGSKAQREVFHDTLLEALLRTGRYEAAEQRLRERLDRRPSPRDFYRLSRLNATTGHIEEAREASQRVTELWSESDVDAPEPAAARQLHLSLS